MRALVIVAAVGMLAIALFARAGHPGTAAAIIHVDGTAVGANDGSDWDNAFTSLQAALAAAVAGDEIWVAAGTYTPGAARTDSFFLKSGVKLLGGFTGREMDPGGRDLVANPTILSGAMGTGVDTDNAYHVVRTDLTDAAAVLDGFIVERGYANALAPQNAQGAGLWGDGSPVVRNVLFRNNVASSGAGAVQTTGGSPTFAGVTFQDNQGASAGAMLIASGATLENVTLGGNHGSSTGAVVIAGGTVSITNVTMSDSSVFAPAGARGIQVSGGTVAIDNSIIYGNGDGAQQVLRSGGTVTISNSSVQGGCPAAPVTCSNLVAGDPQLGSLQHNGGMTPTMVIPATSPMLDAGENSTCANEDQRGVARPQDGDGGNGPECDPGAYELTTSTVQFTAIEFAVGEQSNAAVEVKLNVPSQVQGTVDYAVTGGTATAGEDYSATAGTVTFAAGDTLETIDLGIVDDAEVEPDETIIVTLSGPVGLVLGPGATHTYTILDNEPPRVEFRASSGGGPENPQAVQIAVAVSESTGADIAVPFKVGGTAEVGVDYTLAASPITIPAGETSANLTLAVTDDFLVEEDETVVITLLDPQYVPLGTATKFTYTIRNDDRGTCKGRPATIVGTAAGDTINGTPGDDIIVAGAGNDTIRAGGGRDYVCAGDGKDSVFGQGADDRLFGEAGDDKVAGGGGKDVILGGGGKDGAKGGAGNDTVNGQGAGDTLDGGGGTDAVNGGLGNDSVKGGGGNSDAVKGQGGKDRLAGGLGTGDKCDGGPGVDTLLTAHGCEATTGIP